MSKQAPGRFVNQLRVLRFYVPNRPVNRVRRDIRKGVSDCPYEHGISNAFGLLFQKFDGLLSDFLLVGHLWISPVAVFTCHPQPPAWPSFPLPVRASFD